MLSAEELERYARHIVLREVGGPGQAALKEASVLVIGAGGLGAPALMYLAAAGIGTLGVVDDDVVSLSNLQRQIIHSTPDIGRRKVDSAATQIHALNPHVRFAAHATRLDAKATAILEKLKAGETLPQAAAADRLKVETLTGLKRGEASGPLSAAGVDAVFRTAKDTVGKTEGAQPPDEVVFRVTDIVVPSLDMASEDAKRALETLNRGLSEDILAEYIAWLESDIGVTINQSALNQVVSGGAGDGTN